MNKTWITILIVTGLVLMLTNSCKKNQSASLNVNVGQSYQGGIVAYILQPWDIGYDANVQHGLIAAPSDQSSGIQWYNGRYVLITGTTAAIGTGKSNTSLIISAQGNGNYAATVCTSLTLGGYTDWYLPSENELQELYLNQAIIGGFNTSISAAYWSSSGGMNGIAWSQYFSGGISGGANTNSTCYVRAIRSF